MFLTRRLGYSCLPQSAKAPPVPLNSLFPRSRTHVIAVADLSVVVLGASMHKHQQEIEQDPQICAFDLLQL